MSPKALVALLAVGSAALACGGSNPVAPSPPADGGGGATGGATSSLTVSLSPTTLTADGDPATVTAKIDATGTVTFSTDLGSFGPDASGKPLKELAVALSAGQAQTQLFPGSETGQVNIVAQIGTDIAKVSGQIVAATFLISSVDPASGAPGSTATVIGQGFEAPLRVLFGNVPATVVANAQGQATDGTKISVTVPEPSPALEAGESRAVAVAVTIKAGSSDAQTDTLQGGFTYQSSQDVPSILTVTPNQGPNEGGTNVTVDGDGFEVPSGSSSGARVFFGVDALANVPAQSIPISDYRVVSAQRITLVTPPATGAARFLLNRTINITILNPSTGLSAEAQQAFSYGSEGAPLITSVQPTEGSYTGNAPDGSPIVVEIRGQGFGDDPSQLVVELAGVVQSAVTLQSDPISANSQILSMPLASTSVAGCSPPSGPAAVTNLVTGERAVGAMTFHYTAPTPAFAAGSPLFPASGTASQPSAVVISGSGFSTAMDAVEVLFDGVRGDVFSVVNGGTSLGVVPPAFAGPFVQAPCDNGGSMDTTTPVDVQIVDLDTGCASTVLKNGYAYVPDDTTCRGGTGLTADFTFTVSGLTAAFQDLSQGDPATFAWDFGDGGTDSVKNPVHTYAAAGTYGVMLTITDAAGTTQDSVTKFVTVGP